MGIRDFALANKIAVVTGGGSGICLAFSQLAVHRGARVLIADLRLTSLAEEFLKTADPEAVKFVKCDVTKRADLENLIATPLWTDRPDKMAQYSLEDSKSGYILPEEVAQDMVELIEDGKYESGICLETTAAGKRVLGTWDIAKPEEHMTDDFAQTIERTYGHALATMKKERAA
ncbi:putative Uncharacterized oxidoreductase [Diplocarpon rosae]|nr:putative Uncharacterized oxidoreductase [Diplocarpon rosae]